MRSSMHNNMAPAIRAVWSMPAPGVVVLAELAEAAPPHPHLSLSALSTLSSLHHTGWREGGTLGHDKAVCGSIIIPSLL